MRKQGRLEQGGRGCAVLGWKAVEKISQHKPQQLLEMCCARYVPENSEGRVIRRDINV